MFEISARSVCDLLLWILINSRDLIHPSNEKTFRLSQSEFTRFICLFHRIHNSKLVSERGDWPRVELSIDPKRNEQLTANLIVCVILPTSSLARLIGWLAALAPSSSSRSLFWISCTYSLPVGVLLVSQMRWDADGDHHYLNRTHWASEYTRKRSGRARILSVNYIQMDIYL